MDKKFGEVEITLCNPVRGCSGGSSFSTWLSTLIKVYQFDDNHSSLCIIVSHLVLLYIFLMTNDIEHGKAQ